MYGETSRASHDQWLAEFFWLQLLLAAKRLALSSMPRLGIINKATWRW
jgi:hypothetical protein